MLLLPAVNVIQTTAGEAMRSAEHPGGASSDCARFNPDLPLFQLHGGDSPCLSAAHFYQLSAGKFPNLLLSVLLWF